MTLISNLWIVARVLLTLIVSTTYNPSAIAENKQVPENYAESVMLELLSEEGELDLSVRLARFPETQQGHLWFHLATGQDALSVVDESFRLVTTTAINVEAEEVEFTASIERQSIQFNSSAREGTELRGRVSGTFLVSETRHPEAGTGSIPVTLDLVFEATGQGFRSNSGRWELTGNVRGNVVVDGRQTILDGLGKWHEQTGVRNRFAPAFTYFNVQNENSSILVIAFKDRVVGYALICNELVSIDSFLIQDHLLDERSFVLKLKNGGEIKGIASVVQCWSVPIEGTRRPGTSVIVDSNLGIFRGSLNDWHPVD